METNVAIGTTIVALLSAAASIYTSFRKSRREEKKEDSDRETQRETHAVVQWEKFANSIQERYKADISELQKQVLDQKREIDQLRLAERECVLERAKQESEINNLKSALKELEHCLNKQDIKTPS